LEQEVKSKSNAKPAAPVEDNEALKKELEKLKLQKEIDELKASKNQTYQPQTTYQAPRQATPPAAKKEFEVGVNMDLMGGGISSTRFGGFVGFDGFRFMIGGGSDTVSYGSDQTYNHTYKAIDLKSYDTSYIGLEYCFNENFAVGLSRHSVDSTSIKSKATFSSSGYTDIGSNYYLSIKSSAYLSETNPTYSEYYLKMGWEYFKFVVAIAPTIDVDIAYYSYGWNYYTDTIGGMKVGFAVELPLRF
jgi:hypothetical protein